MSLTPMLLAWLGAMTPIQVEEQIGEDLVTVLPPVNLVNGMILHEFDLRGGVNKGVDNPNPIEDGLLYKMFDVSNIDIQFNIQPTAAFPDPKTVILRYQMGVKGYAQSWYTSIYDEYFIEDDQAFWNTEGCYSRTGVGMMAWPYSEWGAPRVVGKAKDPVPARMADWGPTPNGAFQIMPEVWTIKIPIHKVLGKYTARAEMWKVHRTDGVIDCNVGWEGNGYEAAGSAFVGSRSRLIYFTLSNEVLEDEEFPTSPGWPPNR